MGRRTTRAAPGDRAAPLAHDTTWAGEARSAVGYAALLCALLLTVDALADTLTDLRAALWLSLGALLLLVLWPARVSAGRGRLVSRTLFGERTVRTDRLVSVRWSNGVAQRLVLRDADGNRAELDPKVLIANPPLWHVLDADARTSVEGGLLRCGETALRQMASRIDKETARTVFKVSGIE
ncbi:hypothetical protein ACIBL5_05160 [Streptomyces sp. NPDC050516]|uniref:hypothetical protein n=1 Tax=Streptomyces sp. NPDC050516 TaxID=3365621 RepID=UPI00378B8606